MYVTIPSLPAPQYVCLLMSVYSLEFCNHAPRIPPTAKSSDDGTNQRMPDKLAVYQRDSAD